MPETSQTVIVQALALGKQVQSPEGPLTILDNINLEIVSGEAIAIVGASGSGKSTLLGLLAGLDTPSRGKVWLQGTDLTTLDEDGRARLRAAHVGFVFQSFQLLPALTALENVMLPLELSDHADPRAAALEVLERVGLRERVSHYPNQMSGGEQQRVAIARAYATRPSLLFADEPTGNIDHATAVRIIELLFSLNREQGSTLVLVTHDDSLARHCTRRFTLEAGRLKNGQ